MSINLIAAIGNSGQLGLRGTLPWHNPIDLAFFREKTWGGAIIVGQKTFERMPILKGRAIFPWTPDWAPERLIRFIENSATKREIWIAGGEKTYRAFAPFVNGLRLFSHIKYDGPADAYFPFDAYGMEWKCGSSAK
jgi:dihydrofolate reductase